jgi:hypothetical protein
LIAIYEIQTIDGPTTDARIMAMTKQVQCLPGSMNAGCLYRADVCGLLDFTPTAQAAPGYLMLPVCNGRTRWSRNSSTLCSSAGQHCSDLGVSTIVSARCFSNCAM